MINVIKKILVIILLSASLCDAQDLFFYDAPRPIVWVDQFLEAQTFSDTKINLFWDNTASDAYTLQTSTDNSSWSTIYTGTSLTYQHTGLSIGSLHYYRLKASKARSADSNWAIDNATTLSFTPLAAYNFDGIYSLVNSANEVSNDNIYGTWSNLGRTSYAVQTKGITVLKPFMGYGPTFTYQNTFEPVSTATRLSNAYSLVITSVAQGSFPYMDGDANISLTGDFTIALPEVIIPTQAFADFLSDNTATGRKITFWNANFLTVSIAGSSTSPFYPGFPITVANRWYKFFIQRSSNQIRVGIYNNGAITWGAYVACSTQTLNINRLFQGFTPSAASGFTNLRGSMFFVGSTLTDLQCVEAAKYFSLPNYTASSPLTGQIAIQGTQNYLSIPLDRYVVDSNLSSYFGTTKRASRVLTIGDKSFIATNRLPASPLFSQDGIRVFDHTTNKVSDPIFFPIETNSTDVHLNSGYGIYDNKIYRISVFPWYDVGVNNNIVIDRSGPNFNFDAITRIAQFKKSRNKLGVFTGEPNFNPVNNNLYIVTQELGPTSNGTRLRIYNSTDNCNSFDGNLLVDTSDNTKWVYNLTPLSGTNSIQYVVISIYNTSLTRYENVCIIKSTDGYTWTNLAGGFSKDIRNSNPLTLSDLTSNCSIISTSTLNANTVCRGAWVDTNGELFGIVGDGSANNQTTGVGGIKFFYTNSGTTTLNQITVPGHVNLISPQFMDGGFVKKDITDLTGNTFDAYLSEYLGTVNCWSLIKIRTTDKGATWSFVSKLSTDDTKRHDLVRGSDNYLYSGGKCLLTCIKNDGVYPPTTNGTWFILDISN
jgi:hypothetical protein